MGLLTPGHMPPLPGPTISRQGFLDDGRLVLSATTVAALKKLRQVSFHKGGIVLMTVEEAIEALFDALYTSQGLDFEIKT